MQPISFRDLRRAYHERICNTILGRRGAALTNADSSSHLSRQIADIMAEEMGFPLVADPPTKGQTLGAVFTQHTRSFLEAAFARLTHIRPGEWTFSAAQGLGGIAQFDQYRHLAELKAVIEQYRELRAALEGDYIITPDITIARQPV